jgi:hypothetical protein
MVLDEFLLGVADGLLYGVQLLCQIHARTTRLQHIYYGREVSLGAFQSCSDFGELVHYLTLMSAYPIPLDRIRKEAPHHLASAPRLDVETPSH